jgi:hypothetical protein
MDPGITCNLDVEEKKCIHKESFAGNSLEQQSLGRPQALA